MRDLLLTAIFIGLIPTILYRPYVGALAWAWVSLMSPHVLTYGFANSLPWAMVVAIVTLLALLAPNERKPLPINGITICWLVFLCWMSVTAFTALNPDKADVNFAWRQAYKTHLMLFVSIMLIRGRRHIEQLVWVIVASIGYYGVKGGLSTARHGGVYTVWGPDGTFIAGNNELALALVVLIPLIYYLVRVSVNSWVKRGLWFTIVCCGLSVLGSHSRGAMIAIVAMAMFLIAKSDRRLFLSMVLALVAVFAAFWMPAEWYDRMATISDYEGEGSAESRLTTWATIWNMALSRPLVGAGFRVGSDVLYQMYSPGPWSRAFDAHSIYFQALGEHGFPGLFLYLTIGILTWRKAKWLAATYATGDDGEWVPILMRMIQVSIIGFASGGAFLGLLHYDFPYYLMAIVVMVEATLKEPQGGAAKPTTS